MKRAVPERASSSEVPDRVFRIFCQTLEAKGTCTLLLDTSRISNSLQYY